MISVITTCYKRWDMLDQTLASKQANVEHAGGELIIVTDDIEEAKRRQLAAGTVVVGVIGCELFRVSSFRNFGAAFATSDHLYFIDADVNVQVPAWVDFIEERFDSKYDCIASDANGKGLPVWRTVDRALFEHTAGTMAVSRWVFAKINGFNRNLDVRWGGEDDDLRIRAQRAGGRMCCYPSSTLTSHIPHSDEKRLEHTVDKTSPLLSNCAKTIATMQADWKLHPYETGILDRLGLPQAKITVIRI